MHSTSHTLEKSEELTCGAAGHAALCLKEVETLLDTLRSRMSRGAQVGSLGPFKCAAEAVGTLEGLRSLVRDLEGTIRDQCDPVRHPQGNTQRAEYALQLLGELRINEDTVDILMCGFAALLCLHSSTRQY